MWDRSDACYDAPCWAATREQNIEIARNTKGDSLQDFMANLNFSRLFIAADWCLRTILSEQSESSTGLADNLSLDRIQFHKFKPIPMVGATAYHRINAERIAHNRYKEP